MCTGEAGSTVFGSIMDGVFEGKIVSPTGSFYVEKARHYFPPHQQKDVANQSFHSVIYNENHVEDPYQHKREGKKAVVTSNTTRTAHTLLSCSLIQLSFEFYYPCVCVYMYGLYVCMNGWRIYFSFQLKNCRKNVVDFFPSTGNNIYFVNTSVSHA